MNIDIRFKNAQEYFHMSGPWLADVFLNNKKLQHKFLADNYTLSKDGNFLVLSRYMTPANQDDDNSIKFNVIVFDLKSAIAYVSKECYESLFIQSMVAEDISIFRAFHDSYSEYKESLKFSDQTFVVLDNNYFYASTNG